MTPSARDHNSGDVLMAKKSKKKKATYPKPVLEMALTSLMIAELNDRT